MNGFSQLIRLFNLDVDVYHNAQVCGRWQVNEHELGSTCFHMVTQGRCWLRLEGSDPMELKEGDLLVFPREIPHQLLPYEEESDPAKTVPFDQGTIGVGLFCALARFNHAAHSSFLAALPPVFVVRCDHNQSWSKPLMTLLMTESTNPSLGGEVIINRLAELVFIYGVRDFILANKTETSFLALYCDDKLKRTVEAIHDAPAHKWTLEELAEYAGMSRTAFAQRFRQVSGWTPHVYLTWWRMQVAWGLLQRRLAVIDVAEQVGYDSDTAFSRVFKKQFGQSPHQVQKDLLRGR